MMSTIVQELGRLCRYSKVQADGQLMDPGEQPYALISPQLHEVLDVQGSADEGKLVTLLKTYPQRLDTHMALESEELWDQHKASCRTMHELSVLMRRCCKAREEGDTPMEDDEMSGNRVICYDKGRRHLPLNERYHQRRLLLFAEPQIGKTGAFLGLIEVRCWPAVGCLSAACSQSRVLAPAGAQEAACAQPD